MILANLNQKFTPSAATAFERLQALSPILADASASYLKFFNEEPSAANAEAVHKGLGALFADATQRSGIEEEELRRAFHGFMVMGAPGLMTPMPILAEKSAERFVGTWELKTRLTNGGRSAFAKESGASHARSHIYYERVPGTTTELRQLTTMWTDENHYPREDAVAKYFAAAADAHEKTFLLISLVHIKLRQIDEFTIEYTDEGEVVGSFGEYRKPVRMRSRAVVMRFDNEETLINVPETFMIDEQGNEKPATGLFLLLNVHGGPSSIAFPMSGLPPMFGDSRTMDTVDTYVRISDQPPLIAGWEPISDYYQRMRNPAAAFDRVRAMAAADAEAPDHGFVPAGRSALMAFDQER